MGDLILKMFNFIPITLIITIFFIYNVFTKITSSEIEQRLMEKEWRLFRSIFYWFQFYIFSTVVLAIYSYFLHTDLDYDKISRFFLNDFISYLIMLLLISCFLYYTFFGLIKGKKINWESKVQKIFAIIYLILVPVFLVGTLGLQVMHIILVSKNEKEVTLIIGGAIIYSFMTLLLLTMYSPLFKYLKRNDKVNFFIESTSHERWYLLHPINRSEFLLGNSPLVEDCSQLMVLQRENLFAISILKEKNDK